jgi:predicted DNA-binding transcriptional regulator YafY
MNNPLLTTLEIVAALGDSPATAAELQAQFGGMSIATLKRHIAESRLLGADIESVKFGKSWTYQLNNKADIRVRLARWIDLEKTRDLTS